MRNAVWMSLIAGLLLALPAAAQRVGDKAPEWEEEIHRPGQGSGSSQEKTKRDAFAGRILIACSIRTNDRQSLQVLQQMLDLSKRYSDRGVDVMFTTVEPMERITKKLEELNANNVWWGAEFGGFESAMGIDAYPRCTIIDVDGYFRWFGHPSAVEEALKQEMIVRPPIGSRPGDIADRVARAKQLQAKQQYAQAYTLVRDLALREGSPQYSEVDALRTQLEEQAKKQIGEAMQLQYTKPEECCRMMAAISVRFEGTDVASDADVELGRLRSEKDTKILIRDQVSNAQAQLAADRAAELGKQGRWVDALQRYRDIVADYEETPAGKAAAKEIERISADPKIRKQIDEWQAEQQARRWLAIADQAASLQLWDLAREHYQKVIDTHPKTDAATEARTRLGKLPPAAAQKP